MKYFICQLIDSGITSNLSCISDHNDNITLINPFDCSSHEWGQVEYELLDSFEEGVQNIDIIWSVKHDNNKSTFRIHKRFEPSKYNAIFGLTPSGHIATWFAKETKQILFSWGKSTEYNNSSERKTDNYENRMIQYTYRYVIVFESWNKKEYKWESSEKNFEFISLQEYLLDGTFDKENNENLLKLHNAGIPHKLQLTWRTANSEYKAYYFFNPDAIIAFFEKFYGVHPNTKTDFIFHMDPFSKKYVLSLYRYGLNSPIVINEDCFQLIVFKSGFENYKSINFNQENSAWVW